MSKKKMVKVKANYPYELRTPNLWGHKFEQVGKGADVEHFAEVTEEEAKGLVEAGRCVIVSGKAATTSNEVDFASDEAGELNAKLVADKVLTAKEFKKIEGSGDNDAITVGDINDYVASKTPATPPPPAAVK